MFRAVFLCSSRLEVEMENKQKVAFYTLGCKLNFAETDAISRQFGKEKYEHVEFDLPADIYVINSCTVTETANKKSRQIIKKAIKNAPHAKVVVVGCYSQMKPNEIAKIEGVDLVLGTSEKFNIVNRLNALHIGNSVAHIFSSDIEEVDAYHSSFSIDGRTRSFLKVQDGCDFKCAYCTIPFARGKSRNPSILQVIEQAKEIASNGIKEIILTGVNIGDFGRSTDETLYELVKELDKVEGIERYRISSIEPNLLSEGIIKFVSESKKFLPHFHIPLQSGSDHVLALMKRRYSTELYENKLKIARNFLPDACIGIDVIVGTPGETEEYFNNAYRFLLNLDFAYLHVFTYSEREGTEAILINPKVPEKEKTRRSKLLQELSKRKKVVYYEKFIGKEAQVLFEAKNINGTISGFTEHYVKVELPWQKELVNTIQTVRINGFSSNGNMNATLL